MKSSKMLIAILKKLLSVLVCIYLVGVIVHGQIGPGSGAGTVDPKMVVEAASKAIFKMQNIRYKAVYQGTGAFSTRTPVVSGTMKIDKLASENPVSAKFSAKGQFFQTGAGQPQPFNTTFDGTAINRLRPKERVVNRKKLDFNNPNERKLGFVTSFLAADRFICCCLIWLKKNP